MVRTPRQNHRHVAELTLGARTLHAVRVVPLLAEWCRRRCIRWGPGPVLGSQSQRTYREYAQPSAAAHSENANEVISRHVQPGPRDVLGLW